MIVVWLAALGATLVTGLLTALALVLARGYRHSKPGTLPRWLAALWCLNFLLDLGILYFQMPPLAGPYWGGQWLLWPLLVSGVLALFGGGVAGLARAMRRLADAINGENAGSPAHDGSGWAFADRSPHAVAGSGRAGTAALALVACIAIVVNGLITVSTTWFNPNAQALAGIAHVTTVPATTPLPAASLDHLVTVSRGSAAFKGLELLAANQRIGAQYHTVLTEYTLQSIDGHLYYVAPLVRNNVWVDAGRWESPGYIAVDAENPAVPAALHTGYHMRYLQDSVFARNVTRHVYLSGDTTANLSSPVFMLDDQWRPFYVLALMHPTRGFTGDVIGGALVVNAQSGAITRYALGDVPAWVDRVIPASAVTQYLSWWGMWARAPWFNPSGSNQQTPAIDANDQPQLLYETPQHPVWLVPMLSSESQTTTGVVLFDTKRLAATFYPAAGLSDAASVRGIFRASPMNTRDYTPTAIQLYVIYGQPTWLATYVQSNVYGEAFQEIGLLDARHLSGANVILAPTKAQALARYAQWLTDHNIQTGTMPSGKVVSTQGVIARISATTRNGTTVYIFTLAGQSRLYEAGIALSAQLPLARPGDTVRASYLDTGQQTVTLTAFDDLSVAGKP